MRKQVRGIPAFSITNEPINFQFSETIKRKGIQLNWMLIAPHAQNSIFQQNILKRGSRSPAMPCWHLGLNWWHSVPCHSLKMTETGRCIISRSLDKFKSFKGAAVAIVPSNKYLCSALQNFKLRSSLQDSPNLSCTDTKCYLKKINLCAVNYIDLKTVSS